MQNEAYVRFVDVQKSYDGETLVVRTSISSRRGRVPDPARTVRLGKDHLPDDARRLRDRDPGRDPPRRPADQQRPAAPARYRHGVPELRAVPAHDRRREPGVPAAGAQDAAGRDRRQGRPRARHGADGPLRPSPAGAALRRPAAAGRAGARAGLRARARPDGRAARRPRQAAARADAVRDQAPARAARRHRGLRDPRPVRGADHVGPGRGLQRRADPAARAAGGALRAAREQLRRPVHRREQHAFWARSRRSMGGLCGRLGSGELLDAVPRQRRPRRRAHHRLDPARARGVQARAAAGPRARGACRGVHLHGDHTRMRVARRQRRLRHEGAATPSASASSRSARRSPVGWAAEDAGALDPPEDGQSAAGTTSCSVHNALAADLRFGDLGRPSDAGGAGQ